MLRLISDLKCRAVGDAGLLAYGRTIAPRHLLGLI